MVDLAAASVRTADDISTLTSLFLSLYIFVVNSRCAKSNWKCRSAVHCDSTVVEGDGYTSFPWSRGAVSVDHRISATAPPARKGRARNRPAAAAVQHLPKPLRKQLPRAASGWRQKVIGSFQAGCLDANNNKTVVVAKPWIYNSQPCEGFLTR